MKTVAAAIEFGTSKIITLIAESGSFTRCDIIGSGTVPYTGFSEGDWNDRENLIAEIEASIRAAEVEAKRHIREIYVGVPSEYIHVETAIGEVDVQSSDGRVDEDDIARAMDDAADKLALNQRGGNVLHRSPAWFSVNGGKHTMSPIGTKGQRLQAEVSFIQADPGFVEDVRGCLAVLGIEVAAFMAPTLGMSILLMSFDERDRTPVLIDVGYLNTEVSVVEGDAVTFHAVLPIGGGDITAALASSLEIGMNEAEALKQDYVFSPDEFDAQSDPEVQFDDGSVVAFPREFVQETVESVTEELVEDILETFRYADDRISPRSQVYITGGGLVNMRGSKEYLAERLKRPVKIPVVKAARLNNPRFSSSLGLMDLVFDAVEQQEDDAQTEPKNAFGGLKNLFKKQAVNE